MSSSSNSNDDSNDTNMMLAYAILNPGDKEGKVTKIPKPKIDGPGYALIRVLRAGVCNTDLEILQGYMGFTGVLGHEFVGIVEDVYNDEDKEQWCGKRVCGDINVGCNNCNICYNITKLDNRVGCCYMSRNHCPNRTVLGILKRNGTMAEYITLPISNLHVVPNNITDDVAVFAEPLAAACRIPEQNLIQYTKPYQDKVAILGDGKLGLMIAEVLGREYLKHNSSSNNNNNNTGDDDNKDDDYPSPPILFGKHQHKLDLVKDSGVITKFVAECQDESSFNGVHLDYAGKFDVVVDATGSPAGLSLAAGLCRPMGKLVLKSTCAAGEQFNAAPFVIDELQVIGSRCGPINKALDLLSLDGMTNRSSTNNNDAAGSSSGSDVPPLKVVKYITKCFPLSQADEAIKCAAEKSTMKVQIICSTK